VAHEQHNGSSGPEAQGITIAEQMPDLATNSLSVAFGNFKKACTIVRRLGVRFLLYQSAPDMHLLSLPHRPFAMTSDD
jgi:predicted phage gp36 major capsid-like protein